MSAHDWAQLITSICYAVTIILLVLTDLLQGRRIGYLEERIRKLEEHALRRSPTDYIAAQRRERG